MLLNGGADIESSGCELHVRSTANPALIINNGVTLDVSKTCVAGSDVIDNSGGALDIETSCAVAPNPFAGQFPEPDISSCDHNSGNFNSALISLNPGVYCGSFNFNNANAVVDFAPGTYIIRNGSWTVSYTHLTLPTKA